MVLSLSRGLSTIRRPMIAGLLVLSALAVPLAVAANQGPLGSGYGAMVVETDGAAGSSIYIVQLVEAPVATYAGGRQDLAATAPQVTGARKLDARDPAVLAYTHYLELRQAALLDAMSLQLGRPVEVRFQYQHAYNGIAVVLTPEEAREVARLPDVTLVFRDVEHELLSDAGPAFIGAPALWSGAALGGAGTQGEGVIIGVLDTGINHDHPSFAATSSDGYTHTNPFGAGNYVGYCVSNPSFCNSKLIGAWVMHATPATPEDTNGHGSHTASTAAGNLLDSPIFVAPTISYIFGQVSGVAPRANIIAYLVCAPSCPTSATTAAVNQSVVDGVDVINYSISGGTNPWVETTAVAFRNATAAGVIVSASAGNSGPNSTTVGHQAPWVLTVGAGTHDRAVLSTVSGLVGSNGALPDIQGEGASVGIGTTPMVFAGAAPYNNPLCNPFPAGTFSGQIVVCDRGVIGRVLKGQHVLNAGGAGMILANDAPSASSLNADGHVLPAIHIGYVEGLVLKGWLAAGSNHSGAISQGLVDYGDYGHIVASLSSRGPAGSTVAGLRNVIKPDLVAPGLNVLAAYHSTGTPPAPEFNIISGTSMASPHAAGAAALLRAAYPSWSAAEIKSALMMGSAPIMLREDASTPADSFDQGSGGIDVAAAAGVGLVLDIPSADYVAANPATGGLPGLLNLPSMANQACGGTCSWTRTVRNSLAQSQQWQASVIGPIGGLVGTVTPANFTLAPGASQQLTIQVHASGQSVGPWHFARVELQPVGGSPQPQVTRMPIAIILSDLIFASGFEPGGATQP